MALVTYSTSTTSSYRVLATLGMGIGYRISGGAISAPRPTMQITRSLEGVETTWNSSATSIILQVDAPGIFTTVPEDQGSIQTVTLRNTGTAELIVQAPVFSNISTLGSAIYQGSTYSAPPWTLNPGGQATFGVSFYTQDTGIFNEAMIFRTNESERFSRFDFRVASTIYYEITLSPTSYTTATTMPNENSVVDYNINLSRNGVVRNDIDSEFVASLVGSPAWTIDSQGVNRISLRFNSARFGNQQGTFVSTLTVTAFGVSQSVTNIATHNVDYSQNYARNAWVSQLTRPDAIVAARIDYVKNVRTLTIGVGSGADGSPQLINGGNTYFNVANLDPIEGRGSIPFAFWQTVYQIPLTSTATTRTYYSGDYRVKSQSKTQKDYDWYYGHYNNTGTMFVVEQDNMGNVAIKFNDLRETTNFVEYALDETIERLPRSFYYYSIRDRNNGGRDTAQLGNRLDEFGRIYEPITPPLHAIERIGGTRDVRVYFSATHSLYGGQTINVFDTTASTQAWVGTYPIKSISSSTAVIYTANTAANWVSTVTVSSTYSSFQVPQGENCLFFVGFDQSDNTVTSLVVIPS